MNKLALVVFAMLGSVSTAQAQDCASNFKVQGVPLLTSLTYRSWQYFPKANPDRALKKIARAVAAQGFVGVHVDPYLGSVTAYQDTTGTGRKQVLQVVAREQGSGMRVDVNFTVATGQIAAEKIARRDLCAIVKAAR